MDMPVVDALPFELLCKILSSCDHTTIYRCLSVCNFFKEAALPSLYRTITLKALYSSHSGEALNFDALQTLDKYTYLRSYVLNVKFIFVLSDYVRLGRILTKSGSRLPENRWVNSLSKLPNVVSYTFHHIQPSLALPQFQTIPHELIEQTTSALSNSKLLRELHLLYRIAPSDIVSLRRLSNVRSICLGFASREVVAEMGSWIEQCESFSIRDAYALDSLASIQPYVANLSMLHLGRHHALTNRDLLQLLKHTPKLQQLYLFYDNFLNVELLNKDNRTIPGLTHLDRIAIRHQGVADKSQFTEMFSWIELVIFGSPLTSFSILSDDGKECTFPFPLINLLTTQTRLEFLNIPQIVLRQASLRALFGKLNNLRVLSIMLVDVNVLGFYTSASTGQLTFNLSALYLCSNRKICSYSLVTSQLARVITSLRGSPGHLRRLIQERQTWKALWTPGPFTEREGMDSLKDEYGIATELDEEFSASTTVVHR